MRTHFLQLLLLGLAAPIGATSAVAQGPAPLLRRSLTHSTPEQAVGAPRWSSLPDTARTYPATYWKEGLVIGGGLAGLFGAALAGGLCSSSENHSGSCTLTAIGGFAIMGGAGGSLGALIGGAFPKSQGDSASAR